MTMVNPTTPAAPQRRSGLLLDPAFMARLDQLDVMSRKMLAHDAGVSERFLADLETGVGNASILLLNRLAQALALPVAALLTTQAEPRMDLARSVQILSRLPPERRIQRHRFFFKHVERCVSQPAGLECGQQGMVVHHRPTRRIDEDCPRLHE